MADQIENLIADLHNSFMKIYQTSGAPAVGTPVLAYEAIGLPLSPSMFKLHPTDTAYSVNVAVEQFSNLTNIVPLISDGVFNDTGRKLDDFLGLLTLSPAQPGPGTDVGAFSALKADALKRWDQTLGSLELGNASQFHPAFATPSDWYDPSVNGNWITYQSSTSTTTNPPPPNPAPVPVVFRQGWRVLPPHLTPVLGRPPVVNGAFREEMIVAPHLSAATSAVAQKPAIAAPVVATTVLHTSPVLSVHLPASAVVAAPVTIAPIRQGPISILATATPQPLAASSFTISFEYCVVKATRPWWSDAFACSKGWYVPSMKAGDLSSGTRDNNNGMLPFVPFAMIVVRNLKISGSWSSQDAAALTNAAALGPFNLTGRTIDQQSSSLFSSGMQLLAWICEMQPLLPPESDPALAAAGH